MEYHLQFCLFNEGLSYKDAAVEIGSSTMAVCEIAMSKKNVAAISCRQHCKNVKNDSKWIDKTS